MFLKLQEKVKKMIQLSKNTEEQPNSVTIIISVGGKGTIFPVKLKLEGESYE